MRGIINKFQERLDFRHIIDFLTVINYLSNLGNAYAVRNTKIFTTHYVGVIHEDMNIEESMLLNDFSK